MRRIPSKKPTQCPVLFSSAPRQKGGRAKSPNPGAEVKGIYTTHIRTGTSIKRVVSV